MHQYQQDAIAQSKTLFLNETFSNNNFLFVSVSDADTVLFRSSALFQMSFSRCPFQRFVSLTPRSVCQEHRNPKTFLTSISPSQEFLDSSTENPHISV
jgi:hypothetical protein